MLTRAIFSVALLALPVSSHAASREVSSVIDQVTIFRDRAEVERVTTIDLVAGQNTLIFAAIPQSVNTDSLKVTGKGSADFQLLSVRHRTRILEHDTSAQTQALSDEIKGLERATKVLSRRKERLIAQSQMLADIKLDRELPQSESVLTPRTPKDIQELLRFVSENGAEIDSELDKIENALQDSAEKISVLRARLSQFGSSKRSESIVEVKLDASGAGKAELRLAYQIAGAAWVPDYNLHRSAKSASQHFSLETFGNISQNTGEDWENVKIVLSTARPQLGIARPSLSPIYLSLLQHVVKSKMLEGVRASAPVALYDNLMARKEASGVSVDEPDLAGELRQNAAAAVEQGEVVVYHLNSRVSLKSDGSSERVLIAESNLDGSLLNIAVPSRMSHVFMEGRFKNGKQPLLPGLVNVFSNGNYVGKQSMAYIAPAKDFRLSLGISNDLTIERSKTKDYEDDPGFLRSMRRLRKDYSIRTHNLSDIAQDLVILEPAPVSQNEEISVQLVSQSHPSLNVKDASRIEHTPGVLEWHLTLAPQKEEVITYGTAVEFKSDLSVSGINLL